MHGVRSVVFNGKFLKFTDCGGKKIITNCCGLFHSKMNSNLNPDAPEFYPRLTSLTKSTTDSTEPMDTDDRERPSMEIIPMEILYHIFPYLPTVQLISCRRVCSTWRAVVDAVTRRDDYWQPQCMRDHPSAYEQARTKCSPDLTWRQLYQSLQLWIQYYRAEEKWTDMCFAGQRKISTAYLYKDLFVIHSGNKIVYCDREISTLKKRIRIGPHKLFRENDHIACYFSCVAHYWNPMTDLIVVPKSEGELLLHKKITVPDVYCYVIIEKDVYYVRSLEEDWNKIFVLKCSDNYRSTELINDPLPIWGLSYYKDCLHVMVGGYNVYKIVNNNSEHVNEESNIFGTLKYGFPYQVSLMSESEYGDRAGLSKLMGIDYKITCMLFYNDLIFTGSDKGLLHLYDAEELATNIRASPLQEYNVAEIFDLEKNVSICGIDVVERKNGHTVYVATPKKIVKLDLAH